MVWILARLATAGCAVDPDEDQRLSMQGLVAVGHVVALDAVRSGGAVVIRQQVQLDRIFEGRVASGFVTLETALSGSSCPGDVVYPPATAVWVIGSPVEGAVPVSACTRSTGEYLPSVQRWLTGLASGLGGRYDGAPPVAPGPGRATPFPTPTGAYARAAVHGGWGSGPDDHREARGGGDPELGQVFATTADRVGAIWSADGLDLALWVDRADLARVPTALTPLGSPDVLLEPGATVTVGAARGSGTTVSYDHDGVTVSAEVPTAALGDTWRPDPAPAVETTHFVRRPTPLLDAGGRPIATLGPSSAVRVTGEARGGAVHVEVSADGLRASGWVDPAVLGDGSAVFSGMASGLVDSQVRVELAPGVEIHSGGATVARTTRTVFAAWLAGVGHTAWVEVDTPWGPVAGEARCAEEARQDAVCRP